jgi:hypothetical protein
MNECLAPTRSLTPLGLLLSLVIAGAALLAVALPADAAEAGERQVRWTVSIDFEREAETRGNGGGFAKQKLKSYVEVAATLRSDGERVDFNPLDPADNQRRLLQAQRAQLRAQPAQAELVARYQRIQAQCGADRDCLVREAMKAQGGLPVAAVADGGDDAELPLRYLSYLALGDCRVETRVRIDERNEGAYPDVQGLVPFVNERHADERPAAPLLCAGRQAVLDTQTGTVWQLGGLGVEGARGTRTATRGGRTERGDELIPLNWYEASDWIGEQLRRFPRQGEARKVLPVAQGSGQVKVVLRWRFADR